MGKLTDPNRLVIQHFRVDKVEHAGFAPELNIELAAIRQGEKGSPSRLFMVSRGITCEPSARDVFAGAGTAFTGVRHADPHGT